VNFGQFSQQQQQKSSDLPSKASVGVPSNNDHSSHGLVHKLLASPINQLVQPPWHVSPQLQQQQLQQQQQQSSGAASSSLGSLASTNTPHQKTSAVSSFADAAVAAAAAATLFPLTSHSALAAQKKLEFKSKILAEATSLENVFPDSFSNNKTSSSLVSNTHRNGTAAPINWGGGGSGSGGGAASGEQQPVSSTVKSSPESNPLRSVIESRINQAKQQQAALKAASPPAAVSVKREVEGFVDEGASVLTTEEERSMAMTNMTRRPDTRYKL